MTRVLVIDDHPAMQSGLEAVLSHTSDLIPVGAGSNDRELWPLVKRMAPDVILLDYHLPGQDGLTLCHRLKNTTLPPAVIIYSAYAGAQLATAAAAAGADGIVSKAAPAPELLEAIRRVANGERVMPPLSADAVTGAASKLDEEDRPLLAVLMERGSMADVAGAFRLPLEEAAARSRAIISRLRIEVPPSAGATSTRI